MLRLVSGGTKSDGNTPNKTPQSAMGPSVHIGRMYYLRESSSQENENNFISDVEVTKFGRRADWDRAGNVCGFWRKVKFSECVPSPASEPTMIIVGVWG